MQGFEGLCDFFIYRSRFPSNPPVTALLPEWQLKTESDSEGRKNPDILSNSQAQNEQNGKEEID